MRPTPLDKGSITGWVSSTGIPQTGGFSVAKAGTGLYDVILPPGYRVSSVTAQNVTTIIANVTTTVNRVNTFTSSTGANADAAFSFVATRGI